VPARTWVVNASPLILLGKIGQIDLLCRLSAELIIPSGVAEELEAGQECDPARHWLRAHGRPFVREADTVAPLIAAWDLGRGESQVLQMCHTRPGTEAILDDLAGRRLAEVLGIPHLGTMAVLLLAKSEGLVSTVRPLLEGVRAKGLRVDERLFQHVLGLAGE